MRDTATTFRLPGLFKLAAIVAVTITLLISSGCGKKCCNKCNSCNTGCSTCNTCNTCGVSDAAPASTCTTCQVSGGQYDRVGQAPQSLSVPPAPSNVYAPIGSTSSTNYTETNTTFNRVGASQDLPVFSPAPAPAAPAPVVTPAPSVAPISAPAPAPAQLLPQGQPRSGGQVHTLQKGETVYGVSRQYGVSPKAVLAANHFADPNHLSVGTKVVIPAN